MKRGEILFGKYRIERRLGSGGSGEVYLCSSLAAGSKWAVKRICRNKAGGRFIAIEERILKQLNHTNLPKIVEIFHHASDSYIVESFIEGTTLDKKLRQCGGISLEARLEWSLELCDILTYLHGLKPHPVIYGDMKPSNIMITPDERVVLVDFGISKEYGAHEGREDFLAGTRCYAAPEQLLTGYLADPRADIYSLGVTLHVLFFGTLPGRAGDPGQEPAGRPDEKLYGIVKRCIETDAKARYQSVKQLKAELKQVRDSIISRKNGMRTRIRICLAASFLLSLATYIAVILGLRALG